MKTIVITGTSSGIGLATAKYFAENGWNVAATMRRPENDQILTSLANIKTYQLDVTDENSLSKAQAAILQDFDQIDVVVNNAGYGLMGAFEAASIEQIQNQFDTNVFGLMRVTQAFLPHFRANKSGLFINISSLGGLTTFPLFSLYHSTKWAVEGFSESLSYELAEHGIQVKLIEPGGVKTDFSSRSLDFTHKENLTAYRDISERLQAAMTQSSSWAVTTPEQVAEAIYTAATDHKTQLRYLVGQDAHELYTLRQQMDDDAFIAQIKQQMLDQTS